MGLQLVLRVSSVANNNSTMTAEMPDEQMKAQQIDWALQLDSNYIHTTVFLSKHTVLAWVDNRKGNLPENRN